MAQLTIPEEYAGGLAQIVSLPDGVIDELASALAETPASLDLKTAMSAISPRVPAISDKDLQKLLSTLLALYSLRAFSEAPPDDFVDDIARAMTRSKRPELVLGDPKTASLFRDRFKRLLSFSSLTTASKALFLQHEHEHALCTARIFTDARPVYGEDPTSPPSAAVITHMLKIAYHEGNKLEEIHIALDKKDLLKIKSLIERAESKVVALRKAFESTNISLIE